VLVVLVDRDLLTEVLQEVRLLELLVALQVLELLFLQLAGLAVRVDGLAVQMEQMVPLQHPVPY
jgi:hypothetical protein